MLRKCKIVLAVLIVLMSIIPFPGVSEFAGIRKAEAATAVFTPIAIHPTPNFEAGSWIWLPPWHPATAINTTFNISLPTGIRVTNATLSMTASVSGTCNVTFEFNGNIFHTNPWGAHHTSNRDVTHQLSHFGGGAQQVTINTSAVWISGAWGEIRPPSAQLSITYQFAPSTPTISSPVPGTRHLNTVNLSASSSVVGGGTITYFWDHSLNGISWASIGSTTGALNWNIPSHIPENTTIHLRTTALANGVFSAHSTPITFIRGTDPIEAARLAAEAALIAANNAAARAQTAINQTFFAGQTVGQMTHELRDASVYNNPASPDHGKTAVRIAREARDAAERARIAAEKDEISPVVSIGWDNRKTATRLNAETLNIDASDNRTPVGLLIYEVVVNGAVVANGTGVPSSLLVTVGPAPGLKNITVIVTDQASNTVRASTRIWRL